MTMKAIKNFVAEGTAFIVVTGGMSVNPDDQAPSAIRMTGADVVAYGAPTFPGAEGVVVSCPPSALLQFNSPALVPGA
jgi:molybdopterin biosynthesis enzyme